MDDERIAPSRSGLSADVAIRLPPLEVVARHWPTIEAMLARACDRSRCYRPIDVLHLAFAREFMIWTVTIGPELVAVIVCTAQQYPRRKILEMKFAAGSRMREWIAPAQAHFVAVARELGCDAVSTVGRRGWARAGGGTEVDTICVRELE